MTTITLPLTDERAGAMARHWADRRSCGRTPEFTPDDFAELRGWVRGELARHALTLPATVADHHRALLLVHITEALGLALDAGEQLCDLAGWPEVNP